MADRPTKLAFFLCPGYASICFTCSVEPFRAANILSGEALYEWIMVSADGEPVYASNGVATVAEYSLESMPQVDWLIICAGAKPEKSVEAHTLSIIRSLSRHGIKIAGVSTGAWIMAQAGLLNGYRCTLHWENTPSFVEAFPDIEVTRSVYEIDRDRYTSAGGTTSLDLMLRMIASVHGNNLATEIARYYQHERIRSAGDLQTEARDTAIRIKSEKLINAITVMEANLETPLRSDELAGIVGITPRQLQRLFKEHTGLSPNRYYLDLRLRHARLLLLQTPMPVIDVAVAAGFVSHAHFSKCYRQLFDVTPTEERRRAF